MQKIIGSKFPLAIVFLLFLLLPWLSKENDHTDLALYPSLPAPIAEETVLITSAGQSSDTYIIKDIANNLMIHNYFMPQAHESDLEDIHSVIVVVGYSDIGEKLHGITFEEEYARVSALLEESLNLGIPVLTIHMGDDLRMDTKTKKLLELVSSKSSYLIATENANKDTLFSDLAEKYDIPLTLVSRLSDMSEPMASAFK